eukprot:SM000057S18344  [mRNA]  locus=s57:126651:129954:+ [translate_table: standard]
MPRLSTSPPGACPAFRALVGDELGFVKAVHCGGGGGGTGGGGSPAVVARWGEPRRARGVRCLDVCGDTDLGVAAVGRRDGTVELLDLDSGATLLSASAHSEAEGAPLVDDAGGAPVAGVQLWQRGESGQLCIVSCTEAGKARLMEVSVTGGGDDELQCSTAKVAASWQVLSGGRGEIGSTQLSPDRLALAVGGDGADLALWDLEKRSRAWAAKNPKPDMLGLIPSVRVTAICFTDPARPSKVAVGTGQHEVRLYDTASQRRPVSSFSYGEVPIRAVTASGDGYTLYVGTAAGDMACFDSRNGKLVGAFKGACAGSVRSIAKHHTLPFIASCGLDRFLRVHSTTSRQLVAKVFLKQHLVSVAFDTRESAPSIQALTAGEKKTVESKQLQLGEEVVEAKGNADSSDVDGRVDKRRRGPEKQGRVMRPRSLEDRPSGSRHPSLRTGTVAS